MARGKSSSKIPDLINTGIENAAKSYRHWTLDGAWINQAPEYLMTVEIARALHRGLARTTGVWLERSVTETIEHSGSLKLGAPHKSLNRNGKNDIVLYRKNETPWCVIEVKANGRKGGIVKDLGRLAALLAHRRSGASIQCAALAFYHDCGSGRGGGKEERQRLLEDKADRAKATAAVVCAKYAGVEAAIRCGPVHDEGEDGAWRAYCLFLTAPRRRKKPAMRRRKR